MLSGSLSDRLLQRGLLTSRVVVPGVAAILASLLFLPAILTRSTITAIPYLTAAAFMLSAQNPPIDAGRLDIVPPLLWGRAEGIRTALRTAAQSLAPPLFGFMSNSVLGHGRQGLERTFSLTLILLFASGVILLRAVKTYPVDVATASASRDQEVAGRTPRGRDPDGSDSPLPGPDPPDGDLGDTDPLWPEPPVAT